MDAEFDSTSSSGRVQRAVALIAISLVVILIASVVYLRPSLSAARSSTAGDARYRVAAVDFVSRNVGWVVAEIGDGGVVMLHTTDGGATWARQLTVSADVHPQYVKFFDDRVGVFALVGTRPNLLRTDDGGETWTRLPALAPDATVISWSFVNDTYGWMLARLTKSAGAARLYRTGDGGRTWDDLGVPVPAPAQAYQVHFSYVTTGWLTTSGPSPVAYKSVDFGATWTPVALPAKDGGWPATGQFFVGVQPTTGVGAVASVVYFPPIRGRTGVGGTIRSFPPLTVRAFDGGRPFTYLYSTVLDRLVPNGRSGSPPPNEAILSTVDNGATWSASSNLPSGGALGYFDASHWWWIGVGALKRSDDGGLTWGHVQEANNMYPLSGLLQVLDAKHAWLAADNGSKPLLQRTDDGLHWSTVRLPALGLSMP